MITEERYGIINNERDGKKMGTLCAEGRIEGAILKGNTWLIPENTEKPDDPRRVRKIEQKKC